MGVVAGIIPWNGPWGSGLSKVGTALAPGSVIILKPSPDAPWKATIVGKLTGEETDLAPGVVDVVAAEDKYDGAVMTSDPRVDRVALPGADRHGSRAGRRGEGEERGRKGRN